MVFLLSCDISRSLLKTSRIMGVLYGTVHGFVSTEETFFVKSEFCLSGFCLVSFSNHGRHSHSYIDTCIHPQTGRSGLCSNEMIHSWC
jgi:hypothetical protein